MHMTPRRRNGRGTSANCNQNGYPMLKKSSLAGNESRLTDIDALLDGTAYELTITLERLISPIEIDIGHTRRRCVRH